MRFILCRIIVYTNRNPSQNGYAYVRKMRNYQYSCV